MRIYEILNVGQGDCIFVKPQYNHKCREDLIIIDLGNGQKNITQYFNEEDRRIHIFLTHHDLDHVGGFRYFLGEKFEWIKEITIPFYQNEITLIAKALLGLKGMKNARGCNDFIRALEDIVSNQIFLKNLVEMRNEKPKLSFAYQGKFFDEFISCLNPPLEYTQTDWLGQIGDVDVRILMNELFEPSIAKAFEAYFYMARRNNSFIDSVELDEIILRAYNEENEKSMLALAKANYVMDFFQKNLLMMRQINLKPDRKKISKIYTEFVFSSHDVCTVLKFNYFNYSMLATGDASKSVFKRLINQGTDISADYLKMPHHGSKHNMTKRILKEIHPKVAIISHNNGKFGNAKDSHPNIEIIQMLIEERIPILVTNDVVKNGQVIVSKYNNPKEDMVEILN